MQIAKTHSSIGASSAHRWMECPASVSMAAKLPPQPSSPHAKEGTAAHALAEQCLKTGNDAIEYLGAEFEEHIVTEEMAEAVQVYLDTVRADLKPHMTLEVEKRFHLSHVHPDAYGTNDACITEPYGILRVYDYKHGKGVAVEVEENEQLLYYALGAAKQGDYGDVEIVVVQPRAPHKDGPVRRWRTNIKYLEAWTIKLKDAISKVFAPEPYTKAGEHCRFCPAMAVCPALQKEAFEKCQAVFAKDPMLNQGEALLLPDPSLLSDQEVKRILDSVSLLDSWLRAVETYAFEKAMRGEALEGYKIVHKRSSRQWCDESLVEKVLSSKYGEKIYSKKELLSVAQMEKALGKEGKADLQQYVEVRPGGLTLASVDDKRPAVHTTSAAEAFAAAPLINQS